jgi:glycosyltransferase involved in cell wall biosynthesis
MNNLISVIVPFYNVEKYFERCINSIVNQTYTNLEIILVNDGSSDNSKSICESFLKKDSRIILINQKNGGSSIARNTGLDNATGDIISFVDSDDYIEDTMLERMLNLMTEHNLDVVEIERNAASDDVIFDNSFTIEDPITAMDRILRTTAFQVWKRIYKKSLIEDMRFIPKIIHQDAFFTIDLINKISKIGFLNSPLYRYNRESIGIIRGKYSELRRNSAIRVMEYIKENIPRDPRLKKALDANIVSYYGYHYIQLCRNTTFDKDRSYRIKLKKEILKSSNLSNIGMRSFITIILPIRIMELVFLKLQPLRSSYSKKAI